MHLRYRDNLLQMQPMSFGPRLSLMQVQLDLYNSTRHPGNDTDTLQTIKMVTEQNDRLSKMVKTLLDMSELQTVGER